MLANAPASAAQVANQNSIATPESGYSPLPVERVLAFMVIRRVRLRLKGS